MKLRKWLASFCCLVALPAMLSAQWARYKDSGRPNSLIDMPDGGWVIASELNIFKLSPAADVVWGQKLPSGVYARTAWATPGGDVVATISSGPNVILFKLSALGSIVWNKTYALADASFDVFCPMPDGGAIMIGSLESDLLLCRCSADGEIAWQMACGTDRVDRGTAAAATSDGGVIVLGSSTPAEGGAPMADLWVLRLDAAGGIEWQERIGGTADDVGGSVFQTSDDGFLIAGESASFSADGLKRFWLLKLSATGAIVRQQMLDRAFEGYTIRRALDGSFIAAIVSSPPGQVTRTVVVPILEDGTVIRETAYAPSGPAADLLPTEDGGCLLSIGSGNDSRLMKLRPGGEIEWQKVYGSQYSEDNLYLLRRSGDGGYVLGGHTSSWGGMYYALWIMKTASDGSIGPNTYFVKAVDESSRQEDLTTGIDVAATVEDTSAVPRSTGLVAEAMDLPFTPWGPTTLPALGLPNSHLSVGYGVVSSGPFEDEGKSPGTITPGVGGHTYTTGAAVTIQAVANEGFKFMQWQGNVSLSQPKATFLMDGDKSIAAIFEYTGTGIVKKLKEMGCFIATAAYGDPSHPDVEVLRQFRDKYLMRSRLGRDLVKLYYRYSPPVAAFVAKRPLLRAISRAALAPVVAICSFLLESGTRY
jgi:Divergent InlB B-repeat domain